MRTIKTTCNNEIKIYSSAKEMNVLRYSQFQKYLFSEINIESLKLALERAKAQIFEDEKEKTEIEISNAMYCLKELSSGVNTSGLAFAILVYEINGKKVEDISEDGLKSILEIIAAFEISQQDIEDASEDVKKKINKELEDLFPDFQDKSDRLIYFSKLKNYISFAASLFEEGFPSEEDLIDFKKKRNWFIIKDKTKTISESIVEIEKGFLSILAVLELDLSCNLLQFYSKIEYLNKKNKQEESA
jgi:hypothetical protein